MREKGFLSIVYLDDFLLIAPFYKEILCNVFKIVHLLFSLVFIVNKDKNMLSPSQACRFLGFLFDSEDFSVSIPLMRETNYSK